MKIFTFLTVFSLTLLQLPVEVSAIRFPTERASFDANKICHGFFEYLVEVERFPESWTRTNVWSRGEKEYIILSKRFHNGSIQNIAATIPYSKKVGDEIIHYFDVYFKLEFIECDFPVKLP